MGSGTGLWRIEQGGPSRLSRGSVTFEADLEKWIENDPSLLQGGLEIVGRQLNVDVGPLDLLGMTVQGELVVIEVKRERVRRDTVTQALDYSACIDQMPYEELVAKIDAYLESRHGPDKKKLVDLLEARGMRLTDFEESRSVGVVVVGTGHEPDLDRFIGYLQKGNIPISVVTFEVFQTPEGEKLLLRQLSEEEAIGTTPSKNKPVPLETHFRMAEAVGMGAPFKSIVTTAIKAGLYPRPYKQSVMLTPAMKRNRCLFTIWSMPNSHGKLWAYVAPEAFAEFFGLDEGQVASKLGSKWITLDEMQATKFQTELIELLGPEERLPTDTDDFANAKRK